MLLQEQAEGDDEIDDEAELNLEKVEEEIKLITEEHFE